MPEQETPEYVTNAAWLRQASRVDAIDVVADEFERPVAQGAQAFWTPESPTPWPRTSRGWRSMSRIHARGAERAGADSTM